MFHIRLILTFLVVCSLSSANRWYRMFNSNHDDPCLDRHKRFQRCIPDFVNAAYQKSIVVSSTCTSSSKDFCSQSTSNQNYPTDDLTDMNNPNNLTCWQSDSMKAGENISFVLSLKKKFELTYISLQFCSSIKPDSMAIFKSMDMVCRNTKDIRHWQCVSLRMFLVVASIIRRASHGFHCNTIRITATAFSIKRPKVSSLVPMNKKLYASIQTRNYRRSVNHVLPLVHSKAVHRPMNLIRVLFYKIGWQQRILNSSY
jgi:hypothetical protein